MYGTNDVTFWWFNLNKDENAHRFALSAIRGELLERERDSFGILQYTGYLLSVVKIKKEIERVW